MASANLGNLANLLNLELPDPRKPRKPRKLAMTATDMMALGRDAQLQGAARRSCIAERWVRLC
jgi:hypothetical protein